MVVAFTFVFWGTGSTRRWQQAFEISVSSLTTLGFAEPDGTGRIWIAFVEATIGLGLVALLISYLPTIYSAYNGREKGINRLRPVAGSPPSAHRVPADPAPHGRASTAPTSGERRPTGCSTSSRRTRPSRSSPTSPSPHPTSRGSPPSGPCSTPPRWSSRPRRRDAGEVFAEDARRGRCMVLVYGLPLIVRIARAVNVPLPPPARLPDLMAHVGEPAPPISISRDEYLDAPWPAVAPHPRSSTRARGGGAGAASPGSAPPTTRRCARWPGSPTRSRALDDRPPGRRGQAPLPAPPPAARRLVAGLPAAASPVAERRLQVAEAA